MQPAYRNLIQTSEPAEEPVDLPTAKQHLRVTFSQDDTLIAGYLTAAREWVEKEIRRALVSRTYDLLFDHFAPCPAQWITCRLPERPIHAVWGVFQLPRPPLVSIDAIHYLDLNGIPTLLDPAQYRVIAGGRGIGAVSPAYGVSWPASRAEIGSVVVSYTAGYGTAQNVPQAIKSAILLILGGLYRFREPVSDVAMLPIPFGVRALLSTYRSSIG